MKISLLLTPRLMVILSACTVSIVLLLLMLGFELGLRQAHEDYLAQSRARGETVYSNNVTNASKPNPNSDAGNRAAGSYSTTPVAR